MLWANQFHWLILAPLLVYVGFEVYRKFKTKHKGVTKMAAVVGIVVGVGIGILFLDYSFFMAGILMIIPEQHHETQKNPIEFDKLEKSMKFGEFFALPLVNVAHLRIRKKLSEETRRKLSESHKGQKSWNKGKKISEDQRRKISQSLKGQVPWNKGKKGVYSEESRLKMSVARKGRFGGEKHPMFRKSHSKEAREKMSVARKGISSWNKGMPFSIETRKRMSQARLGKIPWNKNKTGIFSEYSRRKNAEAHKGHIPWNKGKTGIYSEEARRKNALAHTNPPEETRRKIREARLKQIFPKIDSKPERCLQSALSVNGIEFQKHKAILGQPDIFIEPNYCIFVDGDFHHANPRKYSPDKIIWKSYKNRPEVKAKDRQEKDNRINEKLEKQGFRVIRFWSSEINKDVIFCVRKILEFINNPHSTQTL